MFFDHWALCMFTAWTMVSRTLSSDVLSHIRATFGYWVIAMLLVERLLTIRWDTKTRGFQLPRIDYRHIRTFDKAIDSSTRNTNTSNPMCSFRQLILPAISTHPPTLRQSQPTAHSQFLHSRHFHIIFPPALAPAR